MKYFTKAEAKAAAARATTPLQKSMGYGRVLKEEAASAKPTDQFDVFLSHSIADAELIKGVKRLLEEAGLKVYVDWVVDPQLERSKVDKETATTLRSRMRQSKSMIYVATDKSTLSKWMPWELGYFDGFRPDGVAVLPLLDNGSDTFVGQEYLSLYPEVGTDMLDGKQQGVVNDKSSSKRTGLSPFGHGTPSWRPVIKL